MKLERLSPKARVFLIVFLVVAILILSENLIRLIARVSEQTVVKIDDKKKEEIYQSTQEYQDEVYIENSIEKAIALLRNEDYEGLYNVLDKEYAVAMDIDSSEALRVYLLEYFGTPTNIELIEFEDVNERFICTVNVELQDEVVQKIMLVTPKEDDSFSLIFDNVSLILNYNGAKATASTKLKYELISKITREGDYICTFEMTNNTNKTLEGSLENMFVVKTNRKKYYPLNAEDLKDIVLAPGETKFLRYRIDTSTNTYLGDDRVEFIFVEKNGTENSDTIIIENH
ncbi:MAG: hypothetical protein IJO08_04745 [Clostridia bacterium]|nr:hypothetical protein [Clostridia bacterium]